MKKENNRDVRNILMVLGMAVFSALLIALFFIFYYGPSGSYLAGKTLVNPVILEKLNFQAEHPRTGQKVYFIFDHAEFSYFDEKQKKIMQKKLSSTDYEWFYQFVKGDDSLDKPSEKITLFFLDSRPNLLTTTMRTAEIVKESQLFQVIQFVKEDYYRVQLHGKPGERDWAYFYHPKIYDTMMEHLRIQ